jgi:hypothetical protein
VLAVQVDIGRGVGTADFQVVTVSFGQFFLNLLDIQASAAEIVSAAVLAVYSVPAVGDIDNFPILRQSGRNFGKVLGECPVGIQVQYSSHN